jgi:hypothetical protein
LDTTNADYDKKAVAALLSTREISYFYPWFCSLIGHANPEELIPLPLINQLLDDDKPIPLVDHRSYVMNVT